MRHSPNNIDVLIHYYSTGQRHERFDAPAVQGAIEMFLEDGIFEEDKLNPSGVRVSEKGNAWIDMLLGTPYPEFKWVDPRTSRPENGQINSNWFNKTTPESI